MGRRGGATAVVVAAACVYVTGLAFFSIRAHGALRTQMDDLGNMVQAIWGASHGDWLMTQSNDVDGQIRSRFGVHSNFIFWLIAPLYRLWPDPRLLLVLTSVACGLTGVGIYFFARRRLGDRWLAVIPAAAFWASPMVHDANLFDFHVVTIASALLVWMILAFDEGRDRRGFVLLALALSCQEHIPVVTCCYGAFLWLSGRRRVGLIVIVASVAYLAILLKVIVPLVNAGHPMAKLGGNDDRFLWVLRQPGRALAEASQPERLRIVVYFLLSGAALCLREWRFLLLLAPGLVSALFGSTGWMARVTGTYYWSFEAAVIVMASAMAAGRRPPGAPVRRLPLFYLAGVTSLSSLLLSPLPHSLTATWENHASSQAGASLDEIMRGVPASAPLVVQRNLGGHLAERPRVSTYPRRLAQAQYAVFQLRHVGGPNSGLFVRPEFFTLVGMDPPQLVATVQKFLASPRWKLVRQQDGFYLFRRGEDEVASTAAWVAFQADKARLLSEVETADRHRASWARFVAGPWRWQEDESDLEASPVSGRSGGAAAR